jgi:hypothetical protein
MRGTSPNLRDQIEQVLMRYFCNLVNGLALFVRNGEVPRINGHDALHCTE